MAVNRENVGLLAVRLAEATFSGDWYVYGGTPPDPTDCSGVWEYTYNTLGRNVPSFTPLARSTYGQYTEYALNNRTVANEVGDLLYYPGSDPQGSEPGHVVGYVSPGLVFQAEMTGTRDGLYPFDTESWEYRTRPALGFPAAPPLPTAGGIPPADAIQRAGLVPLPNPNDVIAAEANGWTIWVWSHTRWLAAQNCAQPFPTGTPEYANRDWTKKRAGL
jgi:NlpC/P60 family protein